MGSARGRSRAWARVWVAAPTAPVGPVRVARHGPAGASSPTLHVRLRTRPAAPAEAEREADQARTTERPGGLPPGRSHFVRRLTDERAGRGSGPSVRAPGGRLVGQHQRRLLGGRGGLLGGAVDAASGAGA